MNVCERIEKMKGLYAEMNGEQQAAFLAEINDKTTEGKTEEERLTKNIELNVNKLRTGFAGLNTEPWSDFVSALQNLASGVKATFSMIDRLTELRELRLSEQRKQYVLGIVAAGFEFERIIVDGESFRQLDGQVRSERDRTVVNDADMPF